MTFTSDSCSTALESLAAALARSSELASQRKAMRLPSGDQTGLEAPRVASVMVHASPPASESSAICGCGALGSGVGEGVAGASGPRTKAIQRPSGDQRGELSCLPLVRRMGTPVPSLEIIQSDVS